MPQDNRMMGRENIPSNIDMGMNSMMPQEMDLGIDRQICGYVGPCYKGR